MSRDMALARTPGDDAAVTLDKHVMIRISAKQLKAWQDAADKVAGGNLADWIRRSCDAAAKRVWPTVEEMEDMLARGHMIPADAPGAKAVLDRYLAGKITPTTKSRKGAR